MQMSLLEKLWDDTLAGPRPEKGLGRLRKPLSLKGAIWSGEDEMVNSGISKDYSYDSSENEVRVTRSIMIKRPSGCPSPSPAESTPPISPLTGGKEWNRFRSKSS